MAILSTRDGRLVTWKPTTELLCSYCREPFPVQRETLGKINFTFDAVVPDPLEQGEYWYFHKGCSRIEYVLNVHWRWLSMYSVLGIGFAGHGKSSRTQKELQQRMPKDAYDRLSEQWRPALRIVAAKQSHRPALEPKERTILPVRQQVVEARTIPRVPASPRQLGRLAIRFMVLKRDNYRCQMCGIAATDGPHVRLEVDHIIPESRGGRYEPMNLWVLCFNCNRGKFNHLLHEESL